MDIDFHFWATYTAARFADLEHQRAWKIASSAQMVDENALGALGGARYKPDDSHFRGKVAATTGAGYFQTIPIKTEAGLKIFDYQILNSFQTVEDIAKSRNECYKAYWPVFHFLPGNFEPVKSAHADELIRASNGLWVRRTANPQRVTGQSADYFKWLTRPYSPMAISLIRNCQEMVNNDSSDVKKYGLSDYLIGITMHVFIDTWAHQDFVGYTSKVINGMVDRGKPYLIEKRGGIEREVETKFEGTMDAAGGILNVSGEEGAPWLGHGPAGHFPDHSALVFKYMPGWLGNTYIRRDNPKEYMEAFVNMVEAIRCINNNTKYSPITVFDAKRKGIGNGHLEVVSQLINFSRAPSGSCGLKDKDVPDAPYIKDSWDRYMFRFNTRWISRVAEVFSMSDRDLRDWIPGKSEWIQEASDAYRKNNSLTPEKFMELDYFKFNIAAKFHYRFVEQELKLLTGKDLLGEWPVGYAYADDLAVLGRYNAKTVLTRLSARQREISAALRDIQLRTLNQELKEMVTVVIQAVEGASNDSKAQEVLRNAIASEGGALSGLLDDKNLKKLETLSGTQGVSLNVRPADAKALSGSIGEFLDRIGSQECINSLANSLISSARRYVELSDAKKKRDGIKRANVFIDALKEQEGPDGNYDEISLGRLFYDLFVNNKIKGQSFATGLFSLGGSIQTTDESLFTFAATGLINDKKFQENRSTVRGTKPNFMMPAIKNNIPMNESMSIRRLLVRSLDLIPPVGAEETPRKITARESGILWGSIK